MSINIESKTKLIDEYARAEKDTGSPDLIRDPADFDSIYLVMPMKG